MNRFTSRLRDVFRVDRAPQVPRVLCADDDDSVRQLCSLTLTKAGFAADGAADGREVVDKLKVTEYAAILLDLSMPSIHGATVLNILQRDRPELLRRTIIVTGASDSALTDLHGRVAAILKKPVNLDALIGAVTDCCSNDDTIVS